MKVRLHDGDGLVVGEFDPSELRYHNVFMDAIGDDGEVLTKLSASLYFPGLGDHDYSPGTVVLGDDRDDCWDEYSTVDLLAKRHD